MKFRHFINIFFGIWFKKKSKTFETNLELIKKIENLKDTGCKVGMIKVHSFSNYSINVQVENI